MKKRLAAFAATGALAVGAFAGTMGTASATVARPDLSSACSSVSGCFLYEGAFTNAQSCVEFVTSLSNPAGWDCEYYNPVWFSNNGNGWYATSVYFPKYP